MTAPYTITNSGFFDGHTRTAGNLSVGSYILAGAYRYDTVGVGYGNNTVSNSLSFSSYISHGTTHCETTIVDTDNSGGSAVAGAAADINVP